MHTKIFVCIQKYFVCIQKIFVCIHKIFVWPHLRKQNSNIGAYKRGAAAEGRRPPFIGAAAGGRRSYIGVLLSQMRSYKYFCMHKNLFCMHTQYVCEEKRVASCFRKRPGTEELLDEQAPPEAVPTRLAPQAKYKVFAKHGFWNPKFWSGYVFTRKLSGLQVASGKIHPWLVPTASLTCPPQENNALGKRGFYIK